MLSPIRLSQLSLLLQETLRQAFSSRRFRVVAEISNHSYYAQKGFHYFDLIEKADDNSGSPLIAKMAGVAWSAGATKIKIFENITGQKFGNNIKVLVEVSVDYHPLYGLKLTLLDIDAAYTVGALEISRQQTIEKLLLDYPDFCWLENGQLCSFNQSLELPRVIQRIAVVSAKNAAGYQDFQHSLQYNNFGYQFVTESFFTTVQRSLNASAFAHTMQSIEKKALESGLDYDAVVIIRGGGADTDLLLFDQYELAYSVAACPFPVITGIGHQKNETIADLLANTACKTPTQCAELIIQHNRQFEEAIIKYSVYIMSRVQQQCRLVTLQLANIKSQLRHGAGNFIFEHRLAVQHNKTKLIGAYKSYFRIKMDSLNTINRLMSMASPDKMLRRGFALVTFKGKLITHANALMTGDEIKILLGDGVIESKVITTKNTYDEKNTEL